MGLAIVGGFLVWTQLSGREPSCNGRRLSEWMEIYEEAQSANTPACREAIEAVHQMRDKALPYAVGLIGYRKPAWHHTVEQVMEFKLDVRRWCPTWVWLPFYHNPPDRGLICIEMLGAEASPAVPQLLQIIKDGQSPMNSDRAMYALSYVGMEALPPLIAMIKDPDSPHRRRAVYAIRDMKRQPDVGPSVLPVMIGFVDDSDCEVASAAVMALGEFTTEADSAVPVLASALQNTNYYVRRCAAESLEKFGEIARAAAPSLLNALQDPDESVRDAATNALIQIAPDFLAKADDDCLKRASK